MDSNRFGVANRFESIFPSLVISTTVHVYYEYFVALCRSAIFAKFILSYVTVTDFSGKAFLPNDSACDEIG